MKKIFYYVVVPVALYVIIVVFLYGFKHNFAKALDSSLKIIQALAILIGGIWAYHKFSWEKRCESIITLKASLIEYSLRHNHSAAQYGKDDDIVGYKLRMLDYYNQLTKKIHLSYYVPKKLRDKIFSVIWLTIGNDTGENFDKIDENWKKFEEGMEDIYKEFENIISL